MNGLTAQENLFWAVLLQEVRLWVIITELAQTQLCLDTL